MTAPRLDVDLDVIAQNTRVLVDRLVPRGIRVTGVSKASLGSTAVAAAMLRGGATAIGDSLVENLERLRAADPGTPLTLIRSPMLSQVDRVVRGSDQSLNTEAVVLAALSAAALCERVVHDVVLMVELGDLREGVAVDEVVDLAATVAGLSGLRLTGLGTNLACRSGIVPDQDKMDQLSELVDLVEARVGHPLTVVTGGNSANLDWAFGTDDVGRVNELRLGESILLGTEPLHRHVVEGLRTDAFTLAAEVIEVQTKPRRSWGTTGQDAFGRTPHRGRPGLVRQAILALGRQDVDPDGATPPAGMSVLAASSDHLVLDVGDHGVVVGDEIGFQLDYSALVRAMTSPFVRTGTSGPAEPLPAPVPTRGAA